jgi:hypothetical protein
VEAPRRVRQGMSDIVRSFQFKTASKGHDSMNIDNKTILITGAVCQYAPAAANELEVQRREICAQHASQAQQ